ncbi:transcriptional regulator [Flexivirga endophytica]|uniref:Transcriptional regulator n=1 Tax=Flexivirga endophytica TaxID=1849103 RepID=A0A916TJI1_9MICO|nr:helix-turn-helix domain-containing protein [Flexivirga endophytica]GGB48233.1 transcriptional regulator [Flexivirga endophytica]GHB61161.1 transcriptional regulator [Flexivirga endophytica]
MERQDLTRPDPSDAPPLGDSRAQVLGALQAVVKPVSVADIAERVGLHPNTARFHLDGLVEQGLAERETEQRDAPGRPRALYRASEDSTRTGRRSYRLLAQILASYLATQSARPGEAAERAGEEWGRFLTERPAPFRAVDASAAMRELVEILEEVGFAPESVGTSHDRRILLHQCPFREVAEDHADVVCSVHLGLMRGVLSELNAPIEATALEPFVDRSLCVTRLADVKRPPRAT